MLPQASAVAQEPGVRGRAVAMGAGGEGGGGGDDNHGAAGGQLSIAAVAAAAALLAVKEAGTSEEIWATGRTRRAHTPAFSAALSAQRKRPATAGAPDDVDEEEAALRAAYVRGFRAAVDPHHVDTAFEAVSRAHRPFLLLGDAAFAAYWEGKHAVVPGRTPPALLAEQVNAALETQRQPGERERSGKEAAAFTEADAAALITEVDNSDLLVADGALADDDRAHWLAVARRQAAGPARLVVGSAGSATGTAALVAAKRVARQAAAAMAKEAREGARAARASGRAYAAANLLAYTAEAEAAVADTVAAAAERRRQRGQPTTGAVLDVRVSAAAGVRVNVVPAPAPSLAVTLAAASKGAEGVPTIRPCALRLALCFRGICVSARQAALLVALFPTSEAAASGDAAVPAGACDAAALHEALAGAQLDAEGITASDGDTPSVPMVKPGATDAAESVDAPMAAAARLLAARNTSLVRALRVLDATGTGAVSMSDFRYALKMAGCRSLDRATICSVADEFPFPPARLALGKPEPRVAWPKLVASLGPALAAVLGEAAARGLPARRARPDDRTAAMGALASEVFSEAVAAAFACEALGNAAAPAAVEDAVAGCGEWALARCPGTAPGTIDGPLVGMALLAAVEAVEG